MLKYIKKFVKDQRGQSELLSGVILYPSILLIIGGLIQFGLILNAKLLVNQASFAGTLAAVSSTTPDVTARNAVINYGAGTLPGWSTSKNLTVTTSVTGGPGIPGSAVTVNTTFNVPVIVDLIAPTGVTVYQVKGQSTMQLEEKS